MSVVIKRALLSCHDKSGLDRLGRALAQCGVELVASGGTAAFLTKQGLRVTTVETFAGITEQLDGRVKTLHPKIHAGILARRDDPAHLNAVGAQGLIDLVVVNLYPFEETVQRAGVTLAEAIEQIDIGGVALLRAAAKNGAHVLAVSQPGQYDAVIDGLQAGQGSVPETLARQLALAAFELTSAYDGAISRYLATTVDQETISTSPPGESIGSRLPETATVRVRQRQRLRYGENPHQPGAWYVPADRPPSGLGTLTQLQGKELSYNNLLDMDAALRCLLDFEDAPTCVIIKHNSQCGLASAGSMRDAYERAFACDAESAFGGIVGCNRPVDLELAERLTATFLEVILSPSVAPEAVAMLRKKHQLRVVTLEWPHAAAGVEWRHLLGSWLLQEADVVTGPPSAFQVVTKRQPTSQEQTDLLFAWKAAKHAKSNGIVLVQDCTTRGIGQGQPSRVGSVRLAIEKAGERSRGAVAASDGFFPFPDSLELLARAGVTAVVQPGGSIRDAEVVAAADAAGLAMWVTGVRHFRH